MLWFFPLTISLTLTVKLTRSILPHILLHWCAFTRRATHLCLPQTSNRVRILRHQHLSKGFSGHCLTVLHGKRTGMWAETAQPTSEHQQGIASRQNWSANCLWSHLGPSSILNAQTKSSTVTL